MPMDILQFSRVSWTFPHESTGNQFFTESQFESYRALGEYEMQTNNGQLQGDISALFESPAITSIRHRQRDRSLAVEPKSEPAMEPKPRGGV